MAKSEARRQKQLAKKKSKRDDRRSLLSRRTSDDPNLRLAGAENWPIITVCLPETLWTNGIGNCTIGRRMPDGQIAIACFLVDVWCLGVKNAFWRIGTQSDLNSHIAGIKRQSAIEEASPERFAKLIYAAVEYAQSFGFQPHPDYTHARQLLKGIDPTRCNDTFEFGQGGKPHFVSGPHDTPAKIKIIMHRLNLVGGNSTVLVGGDRSVIDENVYRMVEETDETESDR